MPAGASKSSQVTPPGFDPAGPLNRSASATAGLLRAATASLRGERAIDLVGRDSDLDEPTGEKLSDELTSTGWGELRKLRKRGVASGHGDLESGERQSRFVLGHRIEAPTEPRRAARHGRAACADRVGRRGTPPRRRGNVECPDRPRPGTGPVFPLWRGDFIDGRREDKTSYILFLVTHDHSFTAQRRERERRRRVNASRVRCSFPGGVTPGCRRPISCEIPRKSALGCPSR